MKEEFNSNEHAEAQRTRIIEKIDAEAARDELKRSSPAMDIELKRSSPAMDIELKRSSPAMDIELKRSNNLPVIKEKELPLIKPKKPRCNHITISDKTGLSSKCRKNAIDGTDMCGDHQPQIELPSLPRYSAEIAAKSLFSLQLCAFRFCEHIDYITAPQKPHLTGLTEKFTAEQSEFHEAYQRLYEELGPDYIDKIISPAALLITMSLGIVAETIIENEKKIDEQ